MKVFYYFFDCCQSTVAAVTTTLLSSFNVDVVQQKRHLLFALIISKLKPCDYSA